MQKLETNNYHSVLHRTQRIEAEVGEGSASSPYDVLRVLDSEIALPAEQDLGLLETRVNIPSTEGPFVCLEVAENYPESAAQGLVNLYSEYNNAFEPLIEANREWATDYQYCMTGPGGRPVNYGVQIDMVGLPFSFLSQAADLDPNLLGEALRRRGIFEIENSLAGYGILGGMFKREDETSVFDYRFRNHLDAIRGLHNKPIALLAVTDEKYNSMLGFEFGKQPFEEITDREVQAISGFDRLFSPAEFTEYIRNNRGQCDYLLYARTSDPTEKLKKPNTLIDHPLLSNSGMRRIIKANAITFNVDNPDWEAGDSRRINDTKEYMITMRMAYPLGTIEDITSNGFNRFLDSKGKDRSQFDTEGLYSPTFKEYLLYAGIKPEDVANGKVPLRLKPKQGTFGCYGHLNGNLSDKRVRQELRQEIKGRGSYLVQPEANVPSISNINPTDGRTYGYIDRNFFGTINGIDFIAIGGFRNLIARGSKEESKGRYHGSDDTVWQEILIP